MSTILIGFTVVLCVIVVAWLISRERDPNFRRIDEDDFLVAQAKIEAQASLEKLLKLMVATPEGFSSVKITLTTTKGSLEHIWVESLKPGSETENWSGILANEPRDIKGMNLGSPVFFPQADIEDWMVMNEDGSYEGGYSIPAVTQRH
jgi:uncharacterized protein YegJ (DUF2314 family)